MLHDFFKLNGDSNAKIDTPEQLLALLKVSEITDAIYYPSDFSPHPHFEIRGKSFRNVSLSKTRFFWIEFRNCSFEDCLFQGTEFDRCEFHDCVFKCCNFNKCRIVDTYIDPRVFVGLFKPREHANIGVHVFQQLRSNALNTHQPEFFQTADWQFRLWSRRELQWKLRKKERTIIQAAKPITVNFLYELFLGYGHSLTRFLMWSAFFFLIIFGFNCWWFCSDTMTIAAPIKNVDGTMQTFYYTLVTLTTLGYGDITPATSGRMFFAGIEALLGLVWFGMLTSIIVKKAFR